MIKNPPQWPDGARCAVAFSFDVDADSIVHNTKRSQIENFQHEISQMRYDPFVALPRLNHLFGSRNIPVTWFLPGWVIKTYQLQLEILVQDQNEFAHHGFYHEPPNQQTREEEQESLFRGIEAIESFIGKSRLAIEHPTMEFQKILMIYLLTRALLMTHLFSRMIFQ